MNTKAFLISVLVLLGACEGPIGPAGPVGPQGPQGIAGPAGPAGPQGTTKLRKEGQLAFDGSAFFDLPAAAGTLAQPPVFECYLAWDIGGGTVAWVEASNRNFDADATCAIGLTPGASTLRVVIAGGVGGQPYAIVVVY